MFPQTAAGGWFDDALGPADLTGGGAQAVMSAMRSSCNTDAALLRLPPLTSHCTVCFLTGRRLKLVSGPEAGAPLA